MNCPNCKEPFGVNHFHEEDSIIVGLEGPYECNVGPLIYCLHCASVYHYNTLKKIRSKNIMPKARKDKINIIIECDLPEGWTEKSQEEKSNWCLDYVNSGFNFEYNKVKGVFIEAKT